MERALDKIEITTIKLQLGKKEIELTVAEARKLRDQLSELFGKEIVREVHYRNGYKWYWEDPYRISYVSLGGGAGPQNSYGNGTSMNQYGDHTLSLNAS